MASKRQSRILSDLPDCLLVSIISLLPFKESVRTSVLSKRWHNLCRQTTRLVFRESEFVNLSGLNNDDIKFEREVFVSILRQWIPTFTGAVIESFELYLSEPVGFEADIASLVEFAASKQTKDLVVDFSIPVPRAISTVEHLLTLIHYHLNGIDISYIFFNFLYVTNLTVCSFLLQVYIFHSFKYMRSIIKAILIIFFFL